MSIAGGFDLAIERGEATGCETIQIFTKSNRQWAAKPITDEDAAAFVARHEASKIDPIFVHASYLINLGSADDATRERSIAGLVDELKRAEKLRLPFIVIHPGSHGGLGEEAGLMRVGDALLEVLDATSDLGVGIALETMAGQGSTLGVTFEHLSTMLDHADAHQRLGVCLDSCHIFAAGYDFSTAENCASTITAFDQSIGLDRLCAIHLNDSKHELGARKDRHEHIGEGYIGESAFRHLIRDPRLAHVPMVLETPKKGKDPVPDDARNLATLRRLSKA
ncbi:MAG: deoxyribonuclease-4 [Rhodothermales bacterium]|jgi:deoxyribonuclease-4